MPKKTSQSKTSQKKAKKVETKVAQPVAESPVSKAPVVEEQVEPVVDPYMEEFSSVLTELDGALSTIKALRMRIVKLEKRVHKDTKALIKKSTGKRRRNVNPNAEPSGFAKPGPISDELRKFLKLGKDDLIARTDVTKKINAYCKENKLQGENDKRKINPDAALRKLLNVPKDGELTFFNLQKYMKVHFPNKEGVYPTL